MTPDLPSPVAERAAPPAGNPGLRLPPGSPSRRLQIGWWLQACAILALVFGMVLAFAAAVIRLGMRLGTDPQAGLILAGSAGYLLLAGGAAGAMYWAYRRLKPRHFSAAVISAYFLVQLALIGAGGGRLQWTGDAELFHRQIQALAPTGYSEATLGHMSGLYDYEVWARRALPFYLPILRLAGYGFPAAIQGFNALVMALAAWLTWRLAVLLLGPRAAAAALALHVLMPWRLFTHLDLSHHILGGFYFTAGVWILVEWNQPRRSFWQRAGLCLAAFLLFPLMHLEGGIGFVFAGAGGGAFLLAWLMGQASGRKTAAALGALFVLPILFSNLCTGPLDARLHAADRHHYYSGILAWAIHGWAVETGGQYYGPYEQVDMLAPPELKKKTLLRLIASQLYYNPSAMAFRQLPTKAAKYFLAGYASGFEEMLAIQSHPRLRALYIGARTVYLLVLLPLAIAGSLIFLVRFRRQAEFCFWFPFAGIVGAYVVFGQADSRYSVYLHSYFFLAGGAALAWVLPPDARREFSGKSVFSAAGIPALSLLLLCAGWSAGIFGLRPAVRPWVLWNLQQALVQDNAPRPLSPSLAPFEIHLPPPRHGTSWGTIQLPVPDHRAAVFSFFLVPQAGISASWNTPAVLQRRTSRGSTESRLTLPAYVVLEFAPEDAKSFELHSLSSPPPFPVMLGYADLRTEP